MNKERIAQELQFKAVRSGGAGGQHVNKVATKVVLSFDLLNSQGLSTLEKERLIQKLNSRLSSEHLLILQGDTTRSQHRNKELVIARFFEILTAALAVPKKRRLTKPTKGAKEKRLKAKQQNAQRKANRKKPNMD